MLPTTKTASGLSRLLLPGIPPGAGVMLAALILVPEMSISPYFWTILLGGLVVLTLLNVKPRFSWLSALHGFFLARTALSEAREFVLKILGTLEDALGTDFPERHLD